MKQLLTILFFLPLLVKAQSPNLVPNPSFEDTVSCPATGGQVTALCKNWISATSASPDYFHRCSAVNVGVPSNFSGYQQPHSGNAYLGLVTHNSNQTYYEYVGVNIPPLYTGAKYEVSMWLNRSNNYRFATDNIGIFFYDTINSNILTTINLLSTLTPQVYYSSYGVITDTQNWVYVKKEFIADSAYDNIIIGAFLNSNHTYNFTTPSSGGSYAYYLIDDVSIKLVDTFGISFIDFVMCAGDTVVADYYTLFKYNQANVFTVQLSDRLGDFKNATNIGSKNADTSGSIDVVIPTSLPPGNGYRLRIISSSPADTSSDNGINIRIGNIDSTSISISSNSPKCDKQSLNFYATVSDTPATYSWSGPNGFSSTVQNPYISGVTPSFTGDYYSEIKFAGCTVKDTLSVMVYTNPDTPTVTYNTPVCETDTLQLSANTITTGVTYSWSGPNSFTSSDSTIIIPVGADTMSGIYTATVTKNGCSSSDTTNVVVKPLPDTVTLSNNTPICEGDTLKLFSDTSTTGVTYAWTGPQSFSANTRNVTEPNTAPNMSGYYTMSVNLNGCKYIDSTQVNIYAVPAAPLITYDTLLCVGDTLNLTATSLTGATYNWTGPNNFNSNQKSPVRANITLSDTGTYTVIATNNICASPQASVYVTINPQPFVVILGSKDSICDGEQVNFTSFANNVGGTPTYQWYVNAQAVGTGANYSANNLKHNDIVKAEMTEYTKCENPYTDESNDIRMTVLPWLAPSVSIVSDKSGPVPPYHYITFTATATDAGNTPKYQWKRNGNDVIGANGSVWSANTLSDNDDVSVEIISSYLCPQPDKAVSNGITVRILTSIEDIDDLKNIRLYPNPNSGRFIVSGEVLQNNGVVTVEIINALGQHIYQKQVQIQNNKLHHKVVLNTIAPGYYLLRLKDEAGNTSVYKLKVE